MRFIHRFLPLGLLIALCIAVQLDEAYAGLLSYQREAVLEGQWWRLLSASLVHLSWSHLAANLAALSLLYIALLRHISPLRFMLLWSLCAIGSVVGLLFFHSSIAWYVGLSGSLHGLLAIWAGLLWRTQPKLSGLLWILVLGKLSFELSQGAMTHTWLGEHATVHAAHAYGFIAGILYLVVKPPVFPYLTPGTPE